MNRLMVGIMIGSVVGGVLALWLFAEPLCKKGLDAKAGGLFDALGVSKDSSLRGLASGALFS